MCKLDDVVEIRIIEAVCFNDRKPLAVGTKLKAMVLNVEPVEFYTWLETNELFLDSKQAEVVRVLESL